MKSTDRLRKWIITVALVPIFFSKPTGATVTSFDDIEFWVGTGAFSAALIIDWDSGPTPQSLAWGYRWDGATTGLDMLNAVIAADNRFGGVLLTDHGWGWTVDGLGYDLNGNGFDVNDPGDHFQPGWDGVANFWGYFVYDNSSYPWDIGHDWSFSDFGVADRSLSDGSWDGWRYGPGDFGPAIATAIPEPAGSMLFLFGAGVVCWMRRRIAHA